MTDEAHDRSARSGNTPGLALGVILVGVGALLFAGQLMGFELGDLRWPYIVVGAGVAILLVGLLLLPEQAITVGGTVVTVVGLVLLYQDATDHWESWAYAWTLVGPAASGFGLMLWGVRSGNRSSTHAGFWGLLGGLAMFTVGFVFFEAVVGISGRRIDLPEWTLPAIVILIGAVLLVRGLVARDRGDDTAP